MENDRIIEGIEITTLGKSGRYIAKINGEVVATATQGNNNKSWYLTARSGYLFWSRKGLKKYLIRKNQYNAEFRLKRIVKEEQEV